MKFIIYHTYTVYTHTVSSSSNFKGPHKLLKKYRVSEIVADKISGVRKSC